MKEPQEQSHWLRMLAWENGGVFSDPVERDATLFLWQPVFMGGFWRDIETFSDEQLRARIPADVLARAGLS